MEQQLYPQFQNGRVPLATAENASIYPLFDNNVVDERFYRRSMGNIQSGSILGDLFLSKDNINNVQNLLRYNVYLKSNNKYIIGKQSDIELEIVMRSIYLQFARNSPTDIKTQISELNQIVIDQLVPRIISELRQYNSYIERVQNLYLPIDHPKNLNIKGTKQLRSVSSVFSTSANNKYCK
jgi:sugar-specific transcriptional regulator TrmB